MWLFDCGLDIVEWRRTIVVYLSAMAPIILSVYLIYKNQIGEKNVKYKKTY